MGHTVGSGEIEKTNMNNRGFIALQNPQGLMLIMFGFIFVAAFIIAGAIFSRAIEKENRLKREAAKQERMEKE
jgi:hypothetical protein